MNTVGVKVIISKLKELFILGFLVGASIGMFLPLSSLLLKQRGEEELVIGIVVSLYFLAMMIGSQIFPRIMKNRSKTYYLVTPALIVSAGAIVAFCFVSHPVWYGICACVVGTGVSFNFITVQSCLNQSDLEEKSKITGLYAFCYAIGFAIMVAVGPVFLGLFAEMAFVLTGVFLVLVSFLVAKFKVSFIVSQETKQRVPWLLFGVMGMGGFLYGFIENAIVAMYPVYLIDMMPQSLIGIVVSAFALGGVIGLVPLTFFAEKIGTYKACIIYGAFSILGFMVLYISTVFFSAIPFALAMLITIVFAVWAGAFVCALYPITLAGLNGLGLTSGGLIYATSMYAFLYSLGSCVGPVLGGGVMEVVGKYGLFYLCAGVLLVFLLLCVLKKVSFQSDQAKKEGLL